MSMCLSYLDWLVITFTETSHLTNYDQLYKAQYDLHGPIPTCNFQVWSAWIHEKLPGIPIPSAYSHKWTVKLLLDTQTKKKRCSKVVTFAPKKSYCPFGVPRWWAWIERLLHMLYLSWSKQHLADGTHEFTIDAWHSNSSWKVRWELGMDGMVFQFYLHEWSLSFMEM